MTYQEIPRSEALNSIPQRKLEEQILHLVTNCKACSERNIKTIEQAYDGLCEKCSITIVAYNRYKSSNIPFDYWSLGMKDFKGAPELHDLYARAAGSLQEIYKKGDVFYIAGTHGIGKTMTTCAILKKACQKGYTSLYTTLTDIIGALIDSPGEEKFLARRELMMVDFLAIDEVDSRFIPENASDLFGRMLEQVIRTRAQNRLPMIICSNSPAKPAELFTGSIKQSLDSLMSRMTFIATMDTDFRKQGK